MGFYNYIIRYNGNYNEEYDKFIGQILVIYANTYYNILHKLSLMSQDELNYYYHLNQQMTIIKFNTHMTICLNILSRMSIRSIRDYYTQVFMIYYNSIGLKLPENTRSHCLSFEDEYSHTDYRQLFKYDKYYSLSEYFNGYPPSDNMNSCNYYKLILHTFNYWPDMKLKEQDNELYIELLKLSFKMLFNVVESSKLFDTIINKLIDNNFVIKYFNKFVEYYNDNHVESISFDNNIKYESVFHFCEYNKLSAIIINYITKLDLEEAYKFYTNYVKLDSKGTTTKIIFKRYIENSYDIDYFKKIKDLTQTNRLYQGDYYQAALISFINNNYKIFKFMIKLLINKDNKFNISSLIELMAYDTDNDKFKFYIYIKNTTLSFDMVETLRSAIAAFNTNMIKDLLSSYKYKFDATSMALANKTEIKELLLEYMNPTPKDLIIHADTLNKTEFNKYPRYIDIKKECCSISGYDFRKRTDGERVKQDLLDSMKYDDYDDGMMYNLIENSYEYRATLDDIVRNTMGMR